MVNGLDESAPVVNGDATETMATEEDKQEATETGSEEAGNKEDGEVVVIQDTGFNIRIITPGLDPFDLPVSCWSEKDFCTSCRYSFLLL